VTDLEKKATLGRRLKAMFRSLERRPVPARLRDVVDQLEPPPEPPTDTTKS
jgi:hypothetical protein